MSRGLLLSLLLLMSNLAMCRNAKHQAETEDNDFAEFEDLEEEDDSKTQKDTQESHRQNVQSEKLDEGHDAEDGIVEDEDEESEFEHFQDDEEFEGFDHDKPGKPKAETPDINITKVPLHLHARWDSFYLEMIMIAGLVIYFINFINGRTKNQKLANAWFSSHKQLLEQNFSLVGDDGKTSENENPGLMKESENVYTLWCSGRLCCEGMLVELKLIKRQDLIHVVKQFMKPVQDQIVVKVNVNPEDMDTFVFAVANKKTAAQLAKEMADISTFCPEKKSIEKYGLPTSFVLFSEVGEVAANILDPKVTSIFNKHEDLIDSIHISDQYSGPKVQDDQQAKLPEVKKVMIFSFNVPGKGYPNPDNMANMKPLLQIVFYLMDKLRRFKLGKEAKQKTEKTRQKVEEAFMKNTHQQRVEAAQQRREEKRRMEKEKIMSDDDPEKQRKWEEREHRREMKKRAPKLKQLKVKAL